MRKEKLGKEGAFPLHVENENGTIYYSEGINKRFYAACAVVNGMLANDARSLLGSDIESAIKMAYAVADELLKQEDEL